MGLKLPNLQILPVKDLLRHEWHDDSRAKPLAAGLRSSGLLRNPPIVAPLEDGSGRYMVLDGANRTTALGHLDIPHAICQVVGAQEKGLKLKKWNHVLWNWEPDELIKALQDVPGTRFQEIDPNIKRPQKDWPVKTLVWLQTPDGQAYIVRSVPGDLMGRARELALVAEAYIKNAQLDRTTAQRINELDGAYKELTAVVVYPPFTLKQVMKLTAAGVLLPPGVTRFTISPRALRLNYPLEYLEADKSLDEKNAELGEWISQKTAQKGVRYYAEATVLFDE